MRKTFRVAQISSFQLAARLCSFMGAGGMATTANVASAQLRRILPIGVERYPEISHAIGGSLLLFAAQAGAWQSCGNAQ
jgi:hypothetical protein